VRFCMITTFYPPENFGGDGIFVQNLAHALAARGHDVHVIHCRDSYRALAGRRTAEPKRNHANVTVHALESPLGLFSPLATHQTGRPLFKLRQIAAVLDQGFDVIHYHNLSLVGGPKLLEYGDAIKLYTTHEYWLVCPTSLLFQFGRKVCERPRCFACSLMQGRPPQAWRSTNLLERSVPHVDTFLSPSRFSMERHRRMGFTAPMVHLPNFVPSRAPLPAPAPSGDPYFLFAGRLEVEKGVDTLVGAFRRWGKARLLVAGDGAEESRLRGLAGGSDRIEFLGRLAEENLRALCRGAVAVLIPSLYFEVFPLVILEALREGTPVVGRRIGAVAEAVEESGGGLTYEIEADLIAALELLLSNPGYRDELGARGHRHFRSVWSEDAHLDRYFGIIEGAGKCHQPQRVPA